LLSLGNLGLMVDLLALHLPGQADVGKSSRTAKNARAASSASAEVVTAPATT
jgi:hypothetical protein